MSSILCLVKSFFSGFILFLPMLCISLFLTQQDDLLFSFPSTIDKKNFSRCSYMLMEYKLCELVLGEYLLVPLDGLSDRHHRVGQSRWRCIRTSSSQRALVLVHRHRLIGAHQPLPIGYRLFPVCVYEITFITEVLAVKLNKVLARKCRKWVTVDVIIAFTT